MILTFLKEVKDYYEKEQDVECVELVKEEFGSKHIIKFKVIEENGQSLVLFALNYEEDTFPFTYSDIYDDDKLHNMFEMKEKIEKIIRKRIKFLETKSTFRNFTSR